MNCHFDIVDGVGFPLWLVKAEPNCFTTVREINQLLHV